MFARTPVNKYFGIKFPVASQKAIFFNFVPGIYYLRLQTYRIAKYIYFWKRFFANLYTACKHSNTSLN